jgi:hypothetical protein
VTLLVDLIDKFGVPELLVIAAIVAFAWAAQRFSVRKRPAGRPGDPRRR